MSRMLASVSNVNEAKIVFSAGADIIDIKDPAKGALGAVEYDMATAIVNHIAGRCSISATIGDLPMHAKNIDKAISAMIVTGVDIVKVGIFSKSMAEDVLAVISEQSNKGSDIVLVFFADNNPEIIDYQRLAEAGVFGVMIDTANKKNGSLRSIMSDEKLKLFVDQAQSAGLLAGLAGSLGIDDVKLLLRLKPDYLGFRGALCQRKQREDTIDALAVHRIRAMIPKSSDYQLKNDMQLMSLN